MEYLQIEEQSFLPTTETTSVTSSSVENGESELKSSVENRAHGFDLKRLRLNAFLEECQIQALGKTLAGVGPSK